MHIEHKYYFCSRPAIRACETTHGVAPTNSHYMCEFLRSQNKPSLISLFNLTPSETAPSGRKVCSIESRLYVSIFDGAKSLFMSNLVLITNITIYFRTALKYMALALTQCPRTLIQIDLIGPSELSPYTLNYINIYRGNRWLHYYSRLGEGG